MWTKESEPVRRKQTDTHFALLPVQVELVLTDGHHPDGFNQRVAGIPCVNNQTSLSESLLGHCSSVEDNKTNIQYLCWSKKQICSNPEYKLDGI